MTGATSLWSLPLLPLLHGYGKGTGHATVLLPRGRLPRGLPVLQQPRPRLLLLLRSCTPGPIAEPPWRIGESAPGAATNIHSKTSLSLLDRYNNIPHVTGATQTYLKRTECDISITQAVVPAINGEQTSAQSLYGGGEDWQVDLYFKPTLWRPDQHAIFTMHMQNIARGPILHIATCDILQTRTDQFL